MVCCAAALVSCKKAETDTPHPGTDPEPQPEGKAVLYGSLSEATKTYLSPTAETSDSATFKVLWEKNDAIAIIMGGKKTAEYDTQGQGVDKAKFEFKETDPAGTELKKEDEFEAIYPAGLVKSKIGDALSLVWPAEQRYKIIGDTPAGEAGNNPMWATAKVLEGQTIMQFYNLGGVIRFKLSPTEQFNVVMAMISADQPMSGAFALQDITLPESGTTLKKAVISDGSGDVTITPKDAVTISTDGAASFYFAVPEGTYSGIQITLVGDDGKKVNARLAEGKTLEVKRAEVVRLTANGVTPGMEGSNCFIGEGNVPIVITAMGNAFDGTTALDGNDTKAVWKPLNGNADACAVVWETVNTATAPAPGTIIKSATYTNGVLTVVPTGTPGNALVAVKNGEDIVWSYHIWVPDTENSPLSNVTVNGVTFLDRNIGALKVADPNVTDNTKSIGMFYQWGRKDPMLAYCDFNHTNVNGIVSFSTMDNSSDNNDTRLKNTIENPDKFIKNGQNQVVSYTNLWGYQLSGDADKVSAKYEKSIYDPCPAGYRVASHSDYCTAKGGNNNYLTPGKYANNASSFPLNDKLCFPLIGLLDYNITIPTSGNYNGVWTATIRGIDKPAWMLNFTTTSIYVGQSSGSGSNGCFPGSSMNVRCVKDRPTDGYSLVELNHEYIDFFE